MDKKINIMLEEYGYILNKLKHKVKVIEHITKLSFLTCNNAPYLIVYYIEKKHDIVQLYEKLNEENDQLCSLFWIIGTDISEVYSKNLKTNQYNTLRNMIAYSDLKEVNVKNIEEIKSNQFENIFFEAHCFLRDIDGLHPDEALDELCKLIYAKLYDEEIEEGYFNSKCGNNEEYS